MIIEEAFGVVLRERRNQKKISQEDLAHRSGLDRTYISLLERGRRKPTLNTIFALAEGLEIKPNLFVREVETRLGK